MSSNEQRARRSRAQLWLLIAVFFVPLLVSFVLYYGFDGWRPGGSTHHGDLINPARPLTQTTLPTADGSALPEDWLRGKWSLIYIGSGACDEACRASLVHMRQSRLALNEEMKRVARIFLVTDNCCDGEYLDREHEGLIVVRADGEAAASLLASFPSYDNIPVTQANRIYIVDPLGNLMMSYAPDAPARGLLDDLKKLLKLSHIG